jgi:hypothetical protein
MYMRSLDESTAAVTILDELHAYMRRNAFSAAVNQLYICFHVYLRVRKKSTCTKF